MKQTVMFKLILTKEQSMKLESISKEYISTVNNLVLKMVNKSQILNLTSKNVKANLPSAVKNQAIRDARSIYKKSKKFKKVPVLKKNVCIWNNQNYKIRENIVKFPIIQNSKCKRISIKTILTEYQKKLLQNKLGTLRITKKSNKWIAQISVSVNEPEVKGDIAMGVDLGLKVPAVTVTESGKTKFLGNGRQNKYIKRNFRSKRRKMGKNKKLNAIRNLNDKEKRWMRDQDHKISRKIVNFAIQNNVSIIRMEQLKNIRNTARTSRKNKKNLYTWSFYRLSQFIEYKAILVGIKIEYVNPKYTSQICPECGNKNKIKDRNYKCQCGYKGHRDRVGAINIISAPVMDGKSLSA